MNYKIRVFIPYSTKNCSVIFTIRIKTSKTVSEIKNCDMTKDRNLSADIVQNFI